MEGWRVGRGQVGWDRKNGGLEERKKGVVNFSEDTITFYHLCATCERQIDRIGLKKELDKQSYIV